MRQLNWTYALLFMAASISWAGPSLAEGLKVKPIDHEITQKECSACHMAYQPQLMPARSWEALMNGLDDHFGEVATLDDAVTADISAYLVANAADAGGQKSRLLRRLDDKVTPLRITEMPWWIRAHNEISEKSFKRAKVGSKANCIACHVTANKGEYYED